MLWFMMKVFSRRSKERVYSPAWSSAEGDLCTQLGARLKGRGLIRIISTREPEIKLRISGDLITTFSEVVQ